MRLNKRKQGAQGDMHADMPHPHPSPPPGMAVRLFHYAYFGWLSEAGGPCRETRAHPFVGALARWLRRRKFLCAHARYLRAEAAAGRSERGSLH